MTPVVTTIVTVYKRTKFLRQAIKSALSQTLRPLEIIVTDDSDSNEIKSICDAFQLPEIRYRSNPVRLGVALNLRAAISEAKGQYIAILNDDDLWEPEFLDCLVLPLEQNKNRVLAFSDHWIMLENGEIELQQTEENTIRYGRSNLNEGEVSDVASFVIVNNGIPLAMASVFRKDALNLQLLVAEVAGAYDFWISCMLAASKQPIYYLPKRLTRYRVHETMETARKSFDKNENMVFIFRKLLEKNYFPNLKPHIQRKYQEALFICGKDNLSFDRISMTRQYFSQSIGIYPNLKTFVGLMLTYLPQNLRLRLRITKVKNVLD